MYSCFQSPSRHRKEGRTGSRGKKTGCLCVQRKGWIPSRLPGVLSGRQLHGYGEMVGLSEYGDRAGAGRILLPEAGGIRNFYFLELTEKGRTDIMS